MNMFLKNSVIKSTTVEFVGEEAIDDGGPLRELYTIFYDNAPGKLLYGPFLSFQKVCCDWFVARSSRTALFL